MNMNKLLAASLIAAVAMPVASADVCGNGGFYTGLNLGMAHQKVTAKSLNKQEGTEAQIEKAEEALASAEAALTDEDKTKYMVAIALLKLEEMQNAKSGDEFNEDNYLRTEDEIGNVGEYEYDSAKAKKYIAAIANVKKTKNYESETIDGVYKLLNDVVEKESKVADAEADLNDLKNGTTPTLKAKKKWKFLAELNLGYDWRVNDVMLGIDLNAGAIFGKNNIKYFDADGKNEYTESGSIKELWHVALMARVGYLITPQAELYVTAGAKAAQFKTRTLANGSVNNSHATYASKKKIKFIPAVGAGLRYEITPEFFTKIEYTYEFKTRVAVHKGSAHSVSPKIQSHVIKLGVGYRF